MSQGESFSGQLRLEPTFAEIWEKTDEFKVAFDESTMRVTSAQDELLFQATFVGERNPDYAFVSKETSRLFLLRKPFLGTPNEILDYSLTESGAHLPPKAYRLQFPMPGHDGVFMTSLDFWNVELEGREILVKSTSSCRLRIADVGLIFVGDA